MQDTLRTALLQLKTAQRLVRRGGGPIRSRLGSLDERLVFVLGCPRSGTTFLAAALGSVRGFVDLGEVAPHKAAIPKLAALPPDRAAPVIRRTLMLSARLGFVGSRRGIEQTPESAFVLPAIARAFPQANFVHIVRDGRDVVCSLLERGWLSAGSGGGDDAGLAFGPEPRFWVEPERRDEFRQASDARRAAWAWRRYLEAARAAGPFEVRYEAIVADPEAASAPLAEFIGAPHAELAGALGGAHAGSVGRYRRDLDGRQLEDVLSEGGELLRELGYAS